MKIFSLSKPELDIDITEYFNLAEQDKEYVTQEILSIYSANIERDDQLKYYYIKQIKLSVQRAIDNEMYELAEIMERVKKAFEEKYFPN